MTDERQSDGLFEALERLPPAKAGIVFRHYGLPEAERHSLFDEVRMFARRRQIMLLLAGAAGMARAWGADGSHGRGSGEGFRSAPVHDLTEIRAAERDGAAMLFLSPVFSTRSHPGARPLGPARFNFLARRTRLPVIALGGMNAMRARRLGEAHGWAGIDAWA
ncbi:thiamine phosphate synthase [Sphingosinicella sp. CPCC 101087]|uniref:thiamine phosphate synthase n=1 Tax=Sphingosinicella sp. CPCC 101087 TaxID=2497754 RepID=UPI001FB177AA|nr:thiamine phosphate synthase [Sphingosinicella sp. CPCC 101087]